MRFESLPDTEYCGVMVYRAPEPLHTVGSKCVGCVFLGDTKINGFRCMVHLMFEGKSHRLDCGNHNCIYLTRPGQEDNLTALKVSIRMVKA